MFGNIIKSTVLLGAFALGGTGLLLWIGASTEQRIELEQRKVLLQQLGEIIPHEQYDNDLVSDTVQITAPQALGSKKPLTIYRARRDGKPVAAVLTVVAPDGYSGDIVLLVGIYSDGRLAGVRAISHKETPGLGDKIDHKRADWILNFAGKSLTNPSADKWAVKKDGGVFDSFTGATITPRAVVKATRKALDYFTNQQQQLFAADATATNNGDR